MPPDRDVRWIQSLNNYKKALAKLSEAVDMDFDSLSDLEKEGLIQRFEFTYELAWKTLWRLLKEKGRPNLVERPIPVIDQALNDGYLTDEEGWKKMRASRNLTSHTYDEATANEIATDTVQLFHGLFIQLETRLEVERQT